MTTSRRLLDPTAIARLAAAAVGETPDAVIYVAAHGHAARR